MAFDASVKKRTSLTQYRIELIIKYIVFCYLRMISDRKKYSKSDKGRLHFENFLRNRFVYDYLRKNTDFYKNSISDNPNVEIYFQKEEDEEYLTIDGVASDFIDISVKETELTKMLSVEQKGSEIYFAIECKRIEELSDASNYIIDIQKFSDRPHTTLRLPFEGMIAFIENASLNHAKLSDKVSELLKTAANIKTNQLLYPKILHLGFDGSYTSSHKKNYGGKEDFFIYHLLFDYSKIVID